jgi:hypothetical protein
MSDTSQGPGWWLASDGKWYPPEAWTGPSRQSDATTFSAGMPAYPASTSPSYGSPPSPSGYPSFPGYSGGYQLAVPPKTNGLAIASLVCSCVGIIPIALGLPCILGIIFGFVSRSQITRSSGTQQGRGLALAGIIVGFSIIGLFILVVSLVVAFSHGTNCVSTNGQICDVN